MAEVGDIVERHGAKSKYRFGIVTGFCPDGWQVRVRVTHLQSRIWQPEEMRVVGPFFDEPTPKCYYCAIEAEVVLRWQEWLREADVALCWACRKKHYGDGRDAFEVVRIARVKTRHRPAIKREGAENDNPAGALASRSGGEELPASHGAPWETDTSVEGRR